MLKKNILVITLQMMQIYFMAIKNPLVISDLINNDLKLVTDWLKANKLFQNESKQNYV